MEYEHIEHPFPPLWDQESLVLILGSFPSVKSREQQFYYGHKMNRFWAVLSEIFREDRPENIESKKAFLHAHHIALYDVIKSCDIKGSGDASIKNAVPTDLKAILENSKIKTVITNGNKASALYHRYQEADTEIPPVEMPSTSPANAAWTLQRLTEEWKKRGGAVWDLCRNGSV